MSDCRFWAVMPCVLIDNCLLLGGSYCVPFRAHQGWGIRILKVGVQISPQHGVTSQKAVITIVTSARPKISRETNCSKKKPSCCFNELNLMPWHSTYAAIPFTVISTNGENFTPICVVLYLGCSRP